MVAGEARIGAPRSVTATEMVFPGRRLAALRNGSSARRDVGVSVKRPSLSSLAADTGSSVGHSPDVTTPNCNEHLELKDDGQRFVSEATSGQGKSLSTLL